MAAAAAAAAAEWEVGVVPRHAFVRGAVRGQLRSESAFCNPLRRTLCSSLPAAAAAAAAG